MSTFLFFMSEVPLYLAWWSWLCKVTPATQTVEVVRAGDPLQGYLAHKNPPP
jgi:hypothetical protein